MVETVEISDHQPARRPDKFLGMKADLLLGFSSSYELSAQGKPTCRCRFTARLDNDVDWRVLMPDLQEVFAELVAIMRPFASQLEIEKDTPTDLYMNTRHLQKNKKPLFFGAVQLKKKCVTFHLMPVYLQPALLSGLSAELREHMQGKSCFNFSEIDKPLFKELATLTKASYASYKKEGLV